jgi:hypothetical protein
MLTKQKPKTKPPEPAIPESFKSIGAQMRKALTAKAAALCDRYERGEIKLDPLDANALMRVRGGSPHPDHVRRALAIVQDERHTRLSGPKPATAIAVRPAAVVTVEATGSERRKLTADFEKAWLALGRNFLVLGETVLRAEEGGMSVDDLIAVTGLTAARSTAYAARKATKLWRIFQPFAEPAGIVLDCESQFRDFPAELDLDPREARKIVKLIERDTEPDKRGQHRPTREQLKPIIAATVGLRGIGPEKRKPTHNQAESRLQEPSAEMPMRTSTADMPMEAPDTRPGMFGRGVEQAAWEDSGETQEARLGAAFRGPLFPHCDTIDQACCVLRSWILGLTRQFPAEDLSDLDEEMYRQCQVLRDIYRPAIQEAATAAASKSRRAR